MSNQALRDKLFHALRGDALPGLRELDDLVLADIDKIMPIVEAHLDEKGRELLSVLSLQCDSPSEIEWVKAVIDEEFSDPV